MDKESAEDKLKKFVEDQEKDVDEYNEKVGTYESLKKQADSHIKEIKDTPLQQAQENRREEIQQENINIGAGYLEIPIEDLPTKGIFYPVGTKMRIRAASGKEISHWSMMDENELTEISDAVNSVLNSCLSVQIPGVSIANYKDLKEIDRFYVLLAIRDFTFPSGKNELLIKINETETQPVKKDNIDFIDLDESLMKHYDETKRCFVFNIKDNKRVLNIYMPTVGVSEWITKYIQRKTQSKQGFDQDFINMAPLLIKDWRQLDDKGKVYEDFVASCYDFGIKEYTLIAKVRKLLQSGISPVFKYVDEDGAEHTSPLNFLGGFKSIFLPDFANDL